MIRFFAAALAGAMTSECMDPLSCCLGRDSRIPHSAEPWDKTQKMMVR